MHARREFIGKQGAIFQDKEFQRQNANIIECFSQRRSGLTGARLDLLAKSARRDRAFQDAVRMLIPGQIIAERVARFVTRDDHRDLALKRHHGFQNARCMAKRLVCGFEIVAGLKPRLALAIIAIAPGLQNALPAKSLQRGFNI